MKTSPPEEPRLWRCGTFTLRKPGATIVESGRVVWRNDGQDWDWPPPKAPPPPRRGVWSWLRDLVPRFLSPRR